MELRRKGLRGYLRPLIILSFPASNPIPPGWWQTFVFSFPSSSLFPASLLCFHPPRRNWGQMGGPCRKPLSACRAAKPLLRWLAVAPAPQCTGWCRSGPGLDLTPALSFSGSHLVQQMNLVRRKSYEKDGFNAIMGRGCWVSVFCHSSLTAVIITSHGIAQKECEVFSFSTRSIQLCAIGGLLDILYENRKR